MTAWTLHPDCPEAARSALQTLDDVFSLEGKLITRDRVSKVLYVTIAGEGYYIKLSRRAGKGIRRRIGRSRLRGERKNLRRFEAWGLPAARVMAFGIERTGIFFKRGALVTREIPETDDLAELAKRKDACFKDPQWVRSVSDQVAQAMRLMHDHHLGHGDMKWRNILVTRGEHPQIHLIDCPGGKLYLPPLLQYRKNKDIACLDKYGRQMLSRTQRMRFYLTYLGKDRLTATDKKNLRHILRFFLGRE